MKGRDFYDVQWFLARSVSLKKNYLEEKMKVSKALSEPLTEELLKELFEKRLNSIDWDKQKLMYLSF